MADEVLGAGDDPVVTVALGAGAHAAQVGAGLRLGHGQALDPLAGHRGEQVAVPLLVGAGQEDARGAPDGVHLQCDAGPAQLALHQHPGEGVQTTAADLLGHVGGVEAGSDRPAAQLLGQVVVEHAGGLDRHLVGDQFVAHESAGGLDDCLLLGVGSEVHRDLGG